MKGAPEKPIRGTRPASSARRIRTASSTNGTSASGSGTRRARTCAWVRIGSAKTGAGVKASSMPMGSRGIRMSEKRMAASTPSSSTGSSVARAASSGVLHMVRKSALSRRAR